MKPSFFHPEVPLAAYDAFLPQALAESRSHRAWTPADGRLPAIFVSHGAPPVLDDPVWLREFFDWAQSMPKPRGIVMVSAHWENAPVAISATDAHVPLVYDFGGFAPRYYTLEYDTPDAGELARKVVGAFPPRTEIHQYVNRGLDHGAYVPLMAMYPGADIPVVQVSMPNLDPAQLFQLGRRLRSLRDEGVLVIGSGFMTHWMGAFQLDPSQYGTMTDFNADFEHWAMDALGRGDVDTLMDFRRKAPGHQLAHRTSDHYVPLLLALGAADDVHGAEATITGTFFTNSKRSLQIA